MVAIAEVVLPPVALAIFAFVLAIIGLVFNFWFTLWLYNYIFNDPDWDDWPDG